MAAWESASLAACDSDITELKVAVPARPQNREHAQVGEGTCPLVWRLIVGTCALDLRLSLGLTARLVKLPEQPTGRG